MDCLGCSESYKYLDSNNIEKLQLLSKQSESGYNNSYERYTFFHEKFSKINQIRQNFLIMCQTDLSEKKDAIESVYNSLNDQCNFFLFENSVFKQIINYDKNIHDEYTFYINLSHNISDDINENLRQARQRLKLFYAYYSEDNTNKFYEDSINDTLLLINICLNICKYNTQCKTDYNSVTYPHITKSELQEQIDAYKTLQEKYKPYSTSNSFIPNLHNTSLNYENHTGTTGSSSSTRIPNIYAHVQDLQTQPSTFYSKSEISNWP
uniref:Uncharacterized protein n=1 Tax=viral metagenome TaxID=1070528 RepID=A0A6C0H887_9ZZZZ